MFSQQFIYYIYPVFGFRHTEPPGSMRQTHVRRVDVTMEMCCVRRLFSVRRSSVQKAGNRSLRRESAVRSVETQYQVRFFFISIELQFFESSAVFPIG